MNRSRVGLLLGILTLGAVVHVAITQDTPDSSVSPGQVQGVSSGHHSILNPPTLDEILSRETDPERRDRELRILGDMLAPGEKKAPAAESAIDSFLKAPRTQDVVKQSTENAAVATAFLDASAKPAQKDPHRQAQADAALRSLLGNP